MESLTQLIPQTQNATHAEKLIKQKNAGAGQTRQRLATLWNVCIIRRHNARHPVDRKSLREWITESPDNYATLKRPLSESKTDRIYIYDTDFRCDPWDEPTIYDANTLSFKIQVPNP